MQIGEFKLRPYQEQAVESLRGNIREGVRSQILCSPTGSGKTLIAMALLAGAVEKRKRVAFVCDRRTLVEQTSNRLYEAGIEHGVLMGGGSRAPSSPVLVCSAQTLESRGMRDVDLFIIDECHEQRKRIQEYVRSSGTITVGLTATPLSKGLGLTYDAVVNVASTVSLINDGHLSPIKVIAPESRVDVQGLQAGSNGEWAREDLSERSLRIVGDVVAEWRKACDEHYGGEKVPTIAFSASVADSEALAAEFQQAGYDFRVLSYRQGDEENAEVVAAYRAGRCDGIVSCAMINRGFDAPETCILIDQYPLRSSLMTEIQRLGRVMRPAPGKEFGLVLDHAENFVAMAPAIHDYYASGVSTLDDSSKRLKVKRDEGDMQKLRRDTVCNRCRTVLDPGSERCPSCGLERPKRKGGAGIDRVSGRMSLVDGVDGKGRDLPWEGDWWTEICAIASGISDDDQQARRIALAKYRDIFGRWPSGGFERVDRPPVKAVADYSRRRYQRWKVAQKKRSAAG